MKVAGEGGGEDGGGGEGGGGAGAGGAGAGGGHGQQALQGGHLQPTRYYLKHN